MRAALPLLFTVMFASIVSAQTPKVYRPGDVINITVTFEGANVDKIINTGITFSAVHVPQNQQLFNSQFGCNSAKKTGGSVELSCTVPTNIPSSEYHITQIGINIGGVGANYGGGELPPSPTFQIENPASLEKPKIKSITSGS